MTTKTHAKDFSPSQADRWLTCGGSIALIRSMGELPDTSNPASVQGVAAHALLEKALKKEQNPHNFGGKFNGMSLDSETYKYVDNAWTYIRKFKGKMRWAEQQVNISATGDVGTLDAACFNKRKQRLHIFDYKNGRHPVDPKNNRQLMLYAIGVIEKLGLISGQSVWLHIVQPRTNPAVGKMWKTDVQSLMVFSEHVRKEVARIKAGKAKLVPDPKACFWCPAKAICPALKKVANDAAKTDWEIGKPKALDVDLTPVELWLDATRDAMVKGLLTGVSLTHYKLVTAHPRREWKSSITPETLHKLGYKLSDVAPRKLIGIGEAEKLLTIKDLKNSVILKTSDKPHLARIDDARPEYEE